MDAASTPSAWLDSWHPQVDLESPAGQLLRKVVLLVPAGSRITLFGSAPLQLCFDRTFLSADVDCFGPDELAAAVQSARLHRTDCSLYVQVCDHLSFRTSSLWKDRVFVLPLEGRQIVIPHPIDILIGKMSRLDEKDLKAFHLVREKTGHPTETELVRELQNALDLFQPGFDEAQGRDMKTSTRLLWRDLFGKDIDVVEQIIAPALRRRQAAYRQDEAQTDYKAALREIPPPPE